MALLENDERCTVDGRRSLKLPRVYEVRSAVDGPDSSINYFYFYELFQFLLQIYFSITYFYFY